LRQTTKGRGKSGVKFVNNKGAPPARSLSHKGKKDGKKGRKPLEKHFDCSEEKGKVKTKRGEDNGKEVPTERTRGQRGTTVGLSILQKGKKTLTYQERACYE